MGLSRSKKVVVADHVNEDKCESFNVINIHSETAGWGFGLVFGFICVYLVYKDWRRFCSKALRPTRAVERRSLLPTITMEMPEMPYYGQNRGFPRGASPTPPQFYDFKTLHIGYRGSRRLASRSHPPPARGRRRSI